MNEQIEEKPITSIQYSLFMVGALFVSLVILTTVTPELDFINNAQLVYTANSF